MPNIRRNKAEEKIVSYVGGQNSSDDPGEIADNQATYIENNIIGSDGKSIVQRLGQTSFDGGEAAAGISDGRVYGLGVLDYGSTNRLFRSVSDGTNCDIQRLDDTLDGYTDVIADTLTKEKDTEFLQCNNKILVMNGGSDNIYSIDTSNSAADLGSTAGSGHPPKGVTGEWHGSRAWVIDANGLLYYSDAIPGLTVGANEWNQSTQVFQPLTDGIAVKTFKQYELIVYGKKSIELISTASSVNTNWSAQVLNGNIGCVARRTVQNVTNDQIFLSRDGYRLLSRTQFDTIRAGVISKPIQDIIDRINWNAVDTSWAIVVDNKYVTGIPVDSSAYPNMVLVLDLFWFTSTGAPCWTVIKKDDWSLYCATVYRISGVEYMVGGTAITAENRDVRKCFNGASDLDGANAVSAIISTFRGKEHNLGHIDTDKKWSHIYISAKGVDGDTDLEVQYQVNRQSFEQTEPFLLPLDGVLIYPLTTLYPATDLYPAGSDQASDIMWIKDRGRNCRMQIQHRTAGLTPTFYTYSIYGQEKNTKGG